jgi:hypothetical protein
MPIRTVRNYLWLAGACLIACKSVVEVLGWQGDLLATSFVMASQVAEFLHGTSSIA